MKKNYFTLQINTSETTKDAEWHILRPDEQELNKKIVKKAALPPPQKSKQVRKNKKPQIEIATKKCRTRHLNSLR